MILLVPDVCWMRPTFEILILAHDHISYDKCLAYLSIISHIKYTRIQKSASIIEL